MGSKIIKIAMLTMALGVAWLSGAQAQQITEDEMSVTVLKWFYNHYDSPEYPQWEKIKSESNEELFKVTFNFKGQKVSAVYTNKGKRAYENVIYKKNSMPEPLVDYAATNYEKFKIVSLYRHTNYAYGTRINQETNYEMVVKVNGDLATVWFGEGLSRLSNFDTSNLALK